MNDDTNPIVEEAQIINEPDEIVDETIEVDTPNSSPTSNTIPNTTPTFDIASYNATLEIVRRRLVILEKAKKEIMTLKEMYNDIFVNDAGYNAADKIVKEVTKKRKDVTAQLARQPQAVELNGKIKDLKEHIKENEDALSTELMEYYKTAGVTEIEDENGNVQEFTITIRIKPKKRME
jgi:hypothetical protein